MALECMALPQAACDSAEGVLRCIATIREWALGAPCASERYRVDRTRHDSPNVHMTSCRPVVLVVLAASRVVRGEHIVRCVESYS